MTIIHLIHKTTDKNFPLLRKKRNSIIRVCNQQVSSQLFSVSLLRILFVGITDTLQMWQIEPRFEKHWNIDLNSLCHSLHVFLCVFLFVCSVLPIFINGSCSLLLWCCFSASSPGALWRLILESKSIYYPKTICLCREVQNWHKFRCDLKWINYALYYL